MQRTRIETVKYKDREYRVQNAKGWMHIVVKENGKRKLIGVSAILKETLYGKTEPVYFDYIFNYGWQRKINPYYELLLNGRT